MYLSGVEGGWPAAGEVGIAPESFNKGSGTLLRAHNEPLTVPEYAEDGGEEPEIAGVYAVDADGAPRRSCGPVRLGLSWWWTGSSRAFREW
jgi:hypothetical protein